MKEYCLSLIENLEDNIKFNYYLNLVKKSLKDHMNNEYLYKKEATFDDLVKYLSKIYGEYKTLKDKSTHVICEYKSNILKTIDKIYIGSIYMKYQENLNVREKRILTLILEYTVDDYFEKTYELNKYLKGLNIEKVKLFKQIILEVSDYLEHDYEDTEDINSFFSI